MRFYTLKYYFTNSVGVGIFIHNLSFSLFCFSSVYFSKSLNIFKLLDFILNSVFWWSTNEWLSFRRTRPPVHRTPLSHRPRSWLHFGRQVSLSSWPGCTGRHSALRFATGAGFSDQYRSISEEGGPDYWTGLGVEKEGNRSLQLLEPQQEERDAHAQKGPGPEMRARLRECVHAQEPASYLDQEKGETFKGFVFLVDQQRFPFLLFLSSLGPCAFPSTKCPSAVKKNHHIKRLWIKSRFFSRFLSKCSIFRWLRQFFADDRRQCSR